MTTNNATATPSYWQVLGRSDTEVRRQVNDIVQSVASDTEKPERRVDKRFAFPHLITITPIADSDYAQTGDPIHVIGKWVAERGMDFFHSDNISFRRGIVSFQDSETSRQLVLNISWSRFLKPGWYDSGGRFTHVVREASPSEQN